MFSLYSVFRLQQQNNASTQQSIRSSAAIGSIGNKIFLSDGDKKRIDIIAVIGIFGK